MKFTRTPLLPLLLALFTLFAGAGNAHARRGFLLITHGDAISDLGRVKPEFQELVEQDRGPALDRVGFKYGYFGFFWLDLWNWDGEYCVYTGKTFHPVSKAVAAQMLGQSESALSTPLNYRFPAGLFTLLGLGLIKMLPGMMSGKNRVPEFKQWEPSPSVAGRPVSNAPRWTPIAPPVPGQAPAMDAGYAPTLPPPVAAPALMVPPPLLPPPAAVPPPFPAALPPLPPPPVVAPAIESVPPWIPPAHAALPPLPAAPAAPVPAPEQPAVLLFQPYSAGAAR